MTLKVRDEKPKEMIAVATEKIESSTWKRGSCWIMAEYCPFCGVKL
jgi:hypothetical protein